MAAKLMPGSDAINGHVLLYDLAALHAIQEHFEVDDLQKVFDRIGQGSIDAKAMAGLLWAGMKHDNKGEFGVDDALANVAGVPVFDVLQAITQAFSQSMGGEPSSMDGKVNPDAPVKGQEGNGASS